jgi:hypothetical protein
MYSIVGVPVGTKGISSVPVGTSYCSIALPRLESLG